MKLTSDAFESGGMIPRRFTCQGENVNPPLIFHDVPENAKTLVLIMEDPDAPGRPFVHWVVFNIPVIHEISVNYTPGVQGVNSQREVKYIGPCPPSGIHRYFFKCYALTAELPLERGASSHDVIGKMQGLILESTELMGKYQKS
ncbi:YbhB/YbcL family Raf kinase inhibitor-like protein [bacterium]|nr:YbhB/YbcL family Raf kinase inhibitor-like protein [bacterium]